MIVIVGESSSGKSTLANYLMDNYLFKKIITYTTREPRKGEKEGVDYHYITQEQFKELEENGFFAETASYNGWMYGSAKEDYTSNAVAVLTPRGLRSIRAVKIEDIHIIAVYLKVPRRDRLIKCLERGDNIEEAYRRSLSDVGQFDGIEDEVDLVLNNPEYAYSVGELANELINRLIEKGRQHETI